MNVRICIASLCILCLCPAARGQNLNRYLEKPLPSAVGGNAASNFLDADDTDNNDKTALSALSASKELSATAISHWWQRFNDPLLDSLINVATTQNYDVLTAMDRMEMARANLRIERSNFFPSIALSAGWARQQTSGAVSKEPKMLSSAYSAGLNASWEIDLFGSIRKRVKAQRETFFAAKDEQEAVMVSLCAQIASTYITLREMQQELEVVRHNCSIQAKVLEMTEARYKAGLVSKLDVSQARSVYYSTKASIPQMQAGISQQVTSIAILLGTYPKEVRPALEQAGKLPDYMEPVATEIPIDLLLSRPDVRQSYRQVEAQAATLGASRADWLPQVFVKGSVGYSAHDLKNLTKRNSLTFEIAPSLTWTLFSGTKLLNSTRLARAQLDEAIHQFNETVLTAVQETDNALTSYSYSIQQIVEMREVCNYGEETLRLSIDLYKQGLSPFQNVLDALRSLLQYENQLVQAQGSSLLNLISLYQALGGGL